MKKIIILFCLFALPWAIQAQNLQKYEDKEGVDGVFITQQMFKLLSKIDVETDDEEEQKFIELVKNLKGIKILSTTNDEIGREMKRDVSAMPDTDNWEELMIVKKDGKLLEFYSKPGKNEDQLSELFMFLTHRDQEKDAKRYVMLSIEGDIDYDELGHIAGKLKGVPGMDELKDIQKNKK